MSPKAKNYLLVLLTATTVTSGYLAWQQSLRLGALQTELLKVASIPAKAKTRPQSAEPAKLREETSEEPTPTLGEKPPAKLEKAAKNSPGPEGGRPDFSTLMANPDFAKAITLQQRAALDERYANLFKALQLPPAELEKFKTLLVERQTARMDVMASARDQGLNPKGNREDLQKLTLQAQAEVDASIKAELGDSVYSRYKKYDATLPQRNQVNQLDQRLSYSGSPLTQGQAEFLVTALTPTASSTSPTTPPTGDSNRWEGNRNTVIISDAVIQQAQSVLTVEQLEALKQIQTEQQARQKIRDMMRPNSNGTTPTPRK